MAEYYNSVQSLSHVQLFVTRWTAALQASLSLTNSQSLLKLMSIRSVMPSNHLILCHPLLIPRSIFTSIRVFSNKSVLRIRWPKYWSFNFKISPSKEQASFNFTAAVTVCSDFGAQAERKSVTVSIVSPSTGHEVLGLDAMIFVF